MICLHIMVCGEDKLRDLLLKLGGQTRVTRRVLVDAACLAPFALQMSAPKPLRSNTAITGRWSSLTDTEMSMSTGMATLVIWSCMAMQHAT